MTRRRRGRPRRCRRTTLKVRRQTGWTRSSRMRSLGASWRAAPRRGVRRLSRRRSSQNTASNVSGGLLRATGG
eukprot:11775966-Alexandrium_andersonii.AAC.1